MGGVPLHDVLIFECIAGLLVGLAFPSPRSPWTPGRLYGGMLHSALMGCFLAVIITVATYIVARLLMLLLYLAILILAFIIALYIVALLVRGVPPWWR